MILTRTRKKAITKLILYFSLVFLLSLSLYNLELFRREQVVFKKVLGEATVNPDELKIKYWESVILKHPSYCPAYEELLKLYIKNDNILKAEYCKNKIKEINPNSNILKGVN